VPEAHVVSVSGPRPVESLGIVDAHDHLFLDSPAMPGLAFSDTDRSIEEAREGQASGIATIVEMTPIGLGRRPDGMRAVADATGLIVIAASGYHRDAHYPDGHWVHDATVETLADRIVTDLTEGMHPCDWNDPGLPLDEARAGAIKGGASYHRITRSEHKRLEAIGAAAVQTGAAVLVHTEIGTAGHDVVDLLESTGLTTDRIALAHMDRNPDHELHAEIAARGVTLEYDTIGRIKYRPDSILLDLIEAMVTNDWTDRIVLGLDLGSRDYLRAYEGGPGMRYLMRTFVPRLRARVGGKVVERLLVRNPARLYAIAGSGR
jgi:predicted metal-dependent phosphotriesterase family hydrolase